MEYVTVNVIGGSMTASILQDIDHHTASQVRTVIDKHVKKLRPRTLILDFSKVEFIDSSAVGLVMGRYKLMQSISGQVVVQNLNKRCRRLLELSGITRVIKL